MVQQRELTEHQEMRELLREAPMTQEFILRRLELRDANLAQRADT